MSYIILDIDNTISNDEWRLPRIDWKQERMFPRWHEYQLLAGFDPVGNEHLFKDTEHKIIISTGRPIFYAPIALYWLQLQGITPHEIHFRADGDSRHAIQVKSEHASRIQVISKDIVCVYDDNWDVIRMYQRLGVNAERVSLHEESYRE